MTSTFFCVIIRQSFDRLRSLLPTPNRLALVLNLFLRSLLLLLPFLRPSLKNTIDDLDEIEELGHGDILQMGPTLEPTKKLEALLLGCLDDLSSDFRLQTSTNRISAGIDIHLDLGVSRRPNEEDNSRLLLGFKALGSDRFGEVLIRHTELIHDFHSFLRYFQYSLPTIPL